ncbi:MAG: hypothetical protein P8M30_18385 [Planctomycetaceae bacterium]|jgi:hypothetical protein|nr:hypothetical protein [bacterium]MDB4679367.1 hypothetical protein [Planctomycetaceae bacterium]MDC0307853.1 hypothetical protein [Planctomycetaceae bacterium]MDG2391280.1 hypothetical protein [Planctomycetaceae bacterium]
MLRITIHTFLSVLVLALFTGCPEKEAEYQNYSDADQNDDHGHDHGHEHHEGPHGGHVIELTEDHSAHLEVTMGEDRTITIYVLADDVETAIPVAVGDVIFELEGEDDSEIKLELTPMPAEGEPEGTSSVFVVKGEIVPAEIDNLEKLHGHIHITIDGKEYEGELEHDHDHDDHEGHDHDEEDDDHKDEEKAAEKPAAE